MVGLKIPVFVTANFIVLVTELLYNTIRNPQYYKLQ